MNAALENINTRRSVRAFTPERVQKQELETIIQSALYAPSAMNTQNWQFTVVTNPEKLSALGEAIARGLEQIEGRSRGEGYCCYYHAPALIIASGPRDYIHVVQDCSCALENMFLAAHAIGLGSCWINQLGATCDLPEVRKLLDSFGIPAEHRVVGCAAIGHAENQPGERPCKGAVRWVE